MYLYISFFIGLLGVVYTYLNNYKQLPKNYKEFSIKNSDEYKRVSIDRDRYSNKKIPNDIDVIVIGSGIGGLSTAAFLSRVGKKVLVIEKHYIAGGCMHTFEEKGIEHETGIHYIGNIEKRKPILNLITDKEIKWCKLGKDNNDIYDIIVINNKQYNFRTGEENFISDMTEYFPDEKSAIIKYVDLIKKVSQKDLFFNIKIIKPTFLRKLLYNFISEDYTKYVNNSAYDIISSLTKNEELIAVLCGQFGDYGPPPKKASFFVHASIANHYLEGGYYPYGGPGEIAKEIIPVIEKTGGRVLVGKGVKEILIKNNRAIGVEIENGDKIFANTIVSSVGLRNTYNKLIESKEDIDDCYINLIKNIPISTSFIYLFVNLKGTPEELGLKSSNIWSWPDKDYDNMIELFEKEPLNNPIPLFIACSCAKDESWNERYPGKSNAIVLTMAKKEWFNDWEDQRCMHRGEDYDNFKEKFAKRMFEEGLFKYYPLTRDKVEHYDIGTPLSIQHYINSYSGEAYGLDSTPYRYTKAYDLCPETKIKNLYLSGQDICTLGFTGALMGGVLTAHSILGYGTLFDVLIGKNLIKDLKNMKFK